MNLLNLEDWNVLNIESNEHDYRISAEPIPTPTACIYCKSSTIVRFGKRDHRVMDLPTHGKRMGIVVQRRRFLCNTCHRTFSEALPDVDEKHDMTCRLVEYIKRQALRQPFTHVADEVGIDEKLVRLIFQEFTEKQKATHTFVTPTHLGIDEVHLANQMRCVLANVKERTVIDVLKDRNKKTVLRYLNTLPDRDTIEVVAIDMWEPYYDAATLALPGAKVVIDHFHIVKMANEALDRVRKEVRIDLSDRQRRTLMHDKYILLRREKDLDEKKRLILDAWTLNFPLLGKAYRLKEDFFDIWKALDRSAAIVAFREWKASIPEELEPAFKPLLTALGNWHNEILNYWDAPYTTAYVEALNGLIKVENRLGRGYSFEALRAKILYSKGLHVQYRPKYGTGFDQPKDVDHQQQLTYGVSISTLTRLIEEGGF